MRAWLVIATNRGVSLCDWNCLTERSVELVRYRQRVPRRQELEPSTISSKVGTLRLVAHGARQAGVRRFLESLGVVLEAAAAHDAFQELVVVAPPRLRLVALKALGPRAASRLSDRSGEGLSLSHQQRGRRTPIETLLH
jgi:hypothetical protein